ncbi:MAG: hypothetical protein HKN28_03580 [Alphaproteobacteria bacterium]|nr:hypothetical protein [Alphaproteobacteria bacterium]
MQQESKRTVVCIFQKVVDFERALDGLLKAGFDAREISVLGSHQAIIDQFGRIPRPDEMTDSPETPRKTLETEVALHKAIDYISDALALISEVGTAVAAYAIGGPVGVAVGSANMTDTTVEDVLSGFIDDRYRHRFEQNIRGGGMIC